MAKTKSQSAKIQDSLIALGKDKTLQEIDIALISDKSGVPVEEITRAYDSVEDIFWDVVSGHDKASLNREVFSAEDSVQDKIFDLLMRRLEALAEVKPALQKLCSACDDKDYQSLFVKNTVVRNMGWVLDTAGVGTAGIEGEARKRALAWVFGTCLDQFMREEDAGLPKTMMTLDRNLSRAASWQSRAQDAVTLAKGAGAVLASFMDRLRAGRDKTPPDQASSTDQEITH